MRRIAVLVVVLVMAPAAAVLAQGISQPGNDQWRVVDQPSPTASSPAPPARLVPPLSFEPLVLISESPPASTPANQGTTVYRVPTVNAPVYAVPPQPVPPPVTTYKPLVPITPAPKQYYLGRGLFGQPKLYVPEQPIRNFLRYLSF